MDSDAPTRFMTQIQARPATTRPCVFKATMMQQAMLRRTLSDPGAGHYLQQFRWSWSGPLDTDAFTRAWAILAERHEVLRSRFELEDDGHFSMVVDPHTEVPVATSRVGHRKPASVDVFLQQARFRDRERGFALERSPLMRFHIHHLGRDRAEILWTSHHALFDGRGRLNLLREFSTLYRALARGAIAELDPAPRYTDYLAWYQQHPFCESNAFWRRLGTGVRPMPPLPTGQGSSPSEPSQTARHSIRLSSRVTKELKAFSDTHGISLNTLTQGAWALVLTRTSGRKAVSFGAPRAGRHPPLPDAASMVGVFVNTVPIPVTIDPRRSKLEWLREIRSTWMAMRPHEQTPVGLIAKAWNWPEGRPLFETLVGFEKYQLTELIGSGLNGVEWGFELEATTEIPLTVQVYDGRRIRIEMTSSVETIRRSDLERMAARMEQALIALAQPEDESLGSLDCIPDTESRRLRSWSQHKAPYPSRQTLHGLFSRQARERPDATALKTGDTSLTYGEVEAEANRLAHRLVDAGVRPGDRIGLLTDRSTDQVVAMLGILKAGAAYLPLDPEYPDTRLRALLKASKTRLVLVDDRHQARLGSGRLRRLPIKARTAPRNTGTATQRPPRVTAGPDSLAYVMFTSGSTGQPKGVEVPHRAVIRLLFGIDYVQLGKRNRILYLAPAAFDASTFEIWGALLHGGCCVVFPDRVPTIATLAEHLRTERIDTLWLTSSLFNFIIDEAPETLRPVKQLLTGGEALSPPHIARAQKALPGTRLINGYGPTETTTFACCYPIPDGVTADQKSIPIGRPIGNTNCHIVDEELRPVPIGTIGELLIGGAGVALGYLNQPARTAERFLPSPFHAGDRLYRTGDLARWREDGLIEYVGRIDHQVKIRGHRIEPGEIEATLARHPKVRHAAVMVETDPVRGKELVAAVAATEPDLPANEELTRFLGSRLPPYLIPVRILVRPDLPRNVNGKTDRRAVAELMASTRSDPITTGGAKPETREERLICGIFAQVLNRKKVGVADSFFALGGDSLRASVLLFRIAQQAHININLNDLHRAPDPRGLARLIHDRTVRGETKTPDRLVRLRKRTGVAALGTQQWYQQQIRRGLMKSGGNISRAFRVRGPLDPVALRKSIELFVSRHEAVRTRLVKQDEETWVQSVVSEARITLSRTDLSGIPARQRLRQAKARFRHEARTPFRPGLLPRIRVRLTRFSRNDHFVTFIFAHGFFDAVSLAIFYREVTAFYRDFSRGKTPEWPEQKLQLIDYHVWHERRQESSTSRSEAFWKKTLAGIPTDTWFPTDGPLVTEDDGYSDRTTHFMLPPELSAAVHAFCRKSDTTVFMTMMAINAVLVQRHTGQDDFLITSVVDNRDHPDARGIVGHLGGVVLFRARPRADRTFASFLKASVRDWLGAVQNRFFNVSKLGNEILQSQGREGQRLTPFFITHGADDPATFRLEGARVAPVHRHFGAGPNLPKLEIRDTLHGISILISYRTRTFRKSSIERYFARYCELTRLLVADPDTRLSDLPDYLDPTARRDNQSSDPI